MVEDLPDLEHVDAVVQAQPMIQAPSRQKGIREIDKMGSVPPESGMSYYHQPVPDEYEQQVPYSGGNLMYDNSYAVGYRPKNRHIVEPFEQEKQMNPCDCNCKFIYEHIKECDICKRFYKPDTTPYLIIILILIIACAMMAKKLFNF